MTPHFSQMLTNGIFSAQGALRVNLTGRFCLGALFIIGYGCMHPQPPLWEALGNHSWTHMLGLALESCRGCTAGAHAEEDVLKQLVALDLPDNSLEAPL